MAGNPKDQLPSKRSMPCGVAKTRAELPAETGTYPSTVELARLKSLAGDLSLGEDTAATPPGVDPYSGMKPLSGDSPDKPRRRKPDDMRRLDTEIKSKRAASEKVGEISKG